MITITSFDELNVSLTRRAFSRSSPPGKQHNILEIRLIPLFQVLHEDLRSQMVTQKYTKAPRR